MILLEIKNRIIEETLLHRFTRSALGAYAACVIINDMNVPSFNV